MRPVQLIALVLEHGPEEFRDYPAYNVLHASAIVAQTHVDLLDSGMGANLLAAIRPAELFIFL